MTKMFLTLAIIAMVITVTALRCRGSYRSPLPNPLPNPPERGASWTGSQSIVLSFTNHMMGEALVEFVGSTCDEMVATAINRGVFLGEVEGRGVGHP